MHSVGDYDDSSAALPGRDMILKDKIQIDRSPGEVWRFIQSPAALKEWNQKIKAVVPVSWGEPAKGYRFRMRYQVAGFESNFLAELMEYEEPVRLLIYLSGGWLPVRGYIQEEFELTENAGGTLLRHKVELHNFSRNVFSRSLILAGHFVGKFSREKSLRALKEVVETDKHAKLSRNFRSKF
jgi:uncharacterized protein YndB with AHSA1/START domain